MALNFTGRRFHDDQTGTVTFPAWTEQTRVTCRITHAALLLKFGAAPTDGSLLEAFDKHRASIEVTADLKFEALAGMTTITLASNDFPDREPAAPSEERPRVEERERATEDTAEKVQQFRRQARALESAHRVSADIATWNAETAKVIGKLDADRLAGEETPEEAGPEDGEL